MTETLSHLIGGKHSGAAKLDSLNPSNTEDIVARYPDGGAEEVNDAVAAARGAFAGWSNGSPEVRADLLDKIGTMILERRETLGRLLAREEGKTLPEAIGETARA
ncbi:MAG TPA: aldehyde dehydrogenase family protein, partial [Rhizomicrobium sp.]